MQEENNKIKFDPIKYMSRANLILKNIAETIDSSRTTYDIKPGSDQSHCFEEITGKLNEHTFTVKRIKASDLSQPQRLYVSWDNVEFDAEWNDIRFKINIVALIDKFISDKYVYDLNSKSYVMLDRELGIWDKIQKFVNRTKTSLQK